MRNAKNFKYTTIFSLATPVIVFIAIMTGGIGIGHGYAGLMVVFYPAVVALGDFVGDAKLLIIVVQFSIYGIIIDFSTHKSKELWGWAIVILTHIIFLSIAVKALHYL